MSYQAATKNETSSLSTVTAKSGILQRKCAACGTHTFAGDKCDECQKGTLQRKSSNNLEMSEAPPVVHEALQSAGQPLNESTRAFFESRFGHDFSGVRIHTDAVAGKSAGAVNASAYTVGRNVVFGHGYYAPNTLGGQKLLAHELTHVIQQSNIGDVSHNLKVGAVDDKFEREADAVAQSIAEKPQTLQANSAVAAPCVQRGVLGAIGGFFSSIGKGIARLFGSENYSKDELDAYLKKLETDKKIEDNYDSDNKARAVVNRRNEFPALTTDIKTLLISEMLKGATLGADEEAIINLLRSADSPAERATMVNAIGRNNILNDFSGENYRIVEAVTLTAADFSRDALVERLKALPRDELMQYKVSALDADVKMNIDKILAMQNITAPVSISAAFDASGTATLNINGFAVTVLPDQYDDATVPEGMAFTEVRITPSPPPNFMVDGNNIVVSFDPLPPVPVKIQTKYRKSRSDIASGASGYGRGTTEEDKLKGNTGLKFHESRHGVDAFEFLKNNPPPPFEGASGMTVKDFQKAVDDYAKAIDDYLKREQLYSIEKTDCPGKPISGDILQQVGAPATFCRDLH